MYGYATDETPEYMPLTLTLAHKLTLELEIRRKDGRLPWVRPDCKSQVRNCIVGQTGGWVELRCKHTMLSGVQDVGN